MPWWCRSTSCSGPPGAAAARGELGLAERAARAITVRGGQAPALLSVAWNAARAGNLARAEQIVASIADQEWRQLGLHAIQAHRDAPPAARTELDTPPAFHPRPETASAICLRRKNPS